MSKFIFLLWRFNCEHGGPKHFDTNNFESYHVDKQNDKIIFMRFPCRGVDHKKEIKDRYDKNGSKDKKLLILVHEKINMEPMINGKFASGHLKECIENTIKEACVVIFAGDSHHIVYDMIDIGDTCLKIGPISSGKYDREIFNTVWKEYYVDKNIRRKETERLKVRRIWLPIMIEVAGIIKLANIVKTDSKFENKYNGYKNKIEKIYNAEEIKKNIIDKLSDINKLESDKAKIMLKELNWCEGVKIRNNKEYFKLIEDKFKAI